MSRVILLLSSERSGSTLLRVILGRHPAIVAPGELFLLQFADVTTWRQVRPLAAESVLEFLRLVGQPGSLARLEMEWSGRGTHDLYRWMLDRLPPGKRLLDKTPAYATRRETLDSTRELDPFYLWLVRHPLGAVDSYLRVKQQDGSLPERAAKRIKDRVQRTVLGGLSHKGRRREDLWVRQNSNIRDFLATIPEQQQHRLCFESLVEHPGAEVERVCVALGLDYPAGILEQPGSVPVTPGLGDPNFSRHQGISADTANTWRSRYSEADLAPAAVRLLTEVWRPLRT